MSELNNILFKFGDDKIKGGHIFTFKETIFVYIYIKMLKRDCCINFPEYEYIQGVL